MFNKISIGYLTGSQKAIKNHLLSDTLVPQSPYTWGQMFFKPYESPAEYMYCARHTFISAAFLGMIIFDPMLIVTIPTIVLGVVAILVGVENIGKITGSDSLSSWAFDATNYMVQDFCQVIIDLILLPISAVVMLTRGASTALKDRGIYDYDAPTSQPLVNTM
ncbi:hypothetical protein DGG96_00885 [Legionella qingyii]|uniref:Uncharacterized protein n=1 Tax=Legionella qingyii TaxID=2184757 RepID=A0A317U7X6_9GAMM|nr:hypothetical protein [Legionella qingyii]PWY57681.1 hypothetical protein DGG96_00885 [Legionella qingyii]RUR25852.1 hypothetical protein ELY20_01505 [Legionella qingyii]RUR29241.1 hypothetical protein ELY16_00130 [Legionella qingyii]